MGCSPRHPKTKIPSTGDFHCLCAGEDLNLHVLRHTHLKRACLPIPAPAQLAGRIIIVFILLSSKALAGYAERVGRQVKKVPLYKEPLSIRLRRRLTKIDLQTVAALRWFSIVSLFLFLTLLV